MASSLLSTLNPGSTTPGFRLIDGSDIASIMQYFGSAKTGIVALAGGGAVGAPALNAYINKVTVTASANDSVMLPPAIAGLEIQIINAGAQNLRVYCSTGNINNLTSGGVPIADTIIALAGGAGVGFITVAAAAVADLLCPLLGEWKSTVQ